MKEKKPEDVAAAPDIAPTSEIVRTYADVTSIDNTAVYRARFGRLVGFQVTQDEDNIKAAKKTRAALNALVKEVSSGRMAVQRAIKAHPVGAFAFEKTDLEKQIEAESKRLGGDIDRAVNAPKIQLNEQVETFVCFVRGTLAQVNKLAVYANDELGLHFENRGPAAE